MKSVYIFTLVSFTALSSFAARPVYQVNMRLNLKGQTPLALNTAAKTGKKTFVSQFSDDGQVETVVEVLPREIYEDNKKQLKMDLTVTRRVRGQEKLTEKVQLMVPENREIEEGNRQNGGSLSVAVMAHKL